MWSLRQLRALKLDIWHMHEGFLGPQHSDVQSDGMMFHAGLRGFARLVVP